MPKVRSLPLLPILLNYSARWLRRIIRLGIVRFAAGGLRLDLALNLIPAFPDLDQVLRRVKVFAAERLQFPPGEGLRRRRSPTAAAVRAADPAIDGSGLGSAATVGMPT